MNFDQRHCGIALCRAVVVHPLVENWMAQIHAQYGKLEAARQPRGPVAQAQWVGPGQRFVPTASSFTTGAALSEESLRALLAEIGAGATGVWIREELGNALACDLDQAWVRRQYAPGHYPALHAPHGWHQDGALGFDFLSQPEGRFAAAALLPMTTCWIALGPCGLEAPGLEIVTRR